MPTVIPTVSLLDIWETRLACALAGVNLVLWSYVLGLLSVIVPQ